MMVQRKKILAMATYSLCIWATALMAAGCSQPSGNLSFKRNLQDGARAIQAGNLDMADGYIESAKAQAQTHQEKRQAESLEKLADGTRSMLAGDVATARQQWAAIRQPNLNLEVRRQAKQVLNINVPAAPTESYERMAR